MSELVKEISDTSLSVRDKICALESEMRKLPDVMLGDCFPLEHQFADGLYVRTVYVPKGHIIVTKLFKKSHATFLLKGVVDVVTEFGRERVCAPAKMITTAGIKRAIHVIEDTVWTTVHATQETDVEKIEEEFIAKTYQELEGLCHSSQPQQRLQ